MKNIIAIVSGKGGAGKSTCAVRIGAALCSIGKKVLLIDTDAGLRCLDIMTGVGENLVFDLADLLAGQDRGDVILPVKEVDGLSVIAAPQDKCELDGRAFREFMLTADGFDYIIVDFPAGIDLALCEPICDIADFVVVCSADAVGTADSRRMSDALSKLGIDARLIINKYKKKPVLLGAYSGIDELVDTSLCRLLGIVPFDRELCDCTATRLTARTCSQKAFLRIAKRIYGYDIPLPRIGSIQKGK